MIDNFDEAWKSMLNSSKDERLACESWGIPPNTKPNVNNVKLSYIIMFIELGILKDINEKLDKLIAIFEKKENEQ